MQITIIGGGISGLLSAWALLEDPRVQKVTLLEASSAVASQASGANAAQLSYTYVNPLGQPALFPMLSDILLGRNPGLKVLKWDAELIPWGVNLLLNSLPPAFRANRKALLKLALESRALFAKLRDKTGIGFRQHSMGKLQLYPSEAGFADARFLASELKKQDIELKLLSPDETGKFIPNFNLAAKPLFGALYSPIDETAGCLAFCEDLLAWLKSHRPGFSIRFGAKPESWRRNAERITELHLSDGGTVKSDAYLVCAGASTNEVLRKVGVYLPIYPVKGYTLEFDCPPSAKLACSITDHAQKVVFVPFEDKLLVSGMFHFAGHEPGVPPEVADNIAIAASNRLPMLDVKRHQTRFGFRPCTPSSQPVIRPIGAENLFVNSGQGMYGWTLAAASAMKSARQIMGEK
jgi:D-amino-acid dehydrogenase